MSLKEFSEILEALAKVIALACAGTWTYLLFVRNRQKYPRASLKHEVFQKKLSDDLTLVHVALTISNIGSVLLSLESIKTGLYKVVPAPEECLKGEVGPLLKNNEIDWPAIDVRKWSWKKQDVEIEPGEIETFHSDYVIASCVKAVQIHSYVKNITKWNRDIGWNNWDFVDLA